MFGGVFMIRKLKILGTYSPYPKGKHNCPGFLVISDSSKIMLDCGNGALRLLNFPEDLKNLSVIISHMHNDHFGDLGILQYTSYSHYNLGLINDKITIYLPSASNKTKTSSEDKVSGIINEDFAFAEYRYISNNTAIQIGDISVSFLKTSHSQDSYAIKLEDKNSYKIVYTSDISFRDKADIVQFATDTDILICEASLLKEHGFSEFNSHLTAEQAALIAKEANAKSLILTHFWPEEDTNKYLQEAREIFGKTKIAVENDVYFL